MPRPRERSHPSVPPEIVDRIIDFRHHDRRTLAQCSLVCTKWLPAARFHLFRSIFIKRQKRLEELSTFIRAKPQTTTPVSVHIRHLVVGSRRGIFTWRGSHKHFAIASHCRLLVSLTLLPFEWKADSYVSAPSPRSLKILKLSNAGFNTCKELLEILCHIPSLENLTLHAVKWREGCWP